MTGSSLWLSASLVVIWILAESIFCSPSRAQISFVSHLREPPTSFVNRTVWDLLKQDAQFSTFAGLICENETLVEMLEKCNLTVFAPNDEEFEMDGQEQVIRVLERKYENLQEKMMEALADVLMSEENGPDQGADVLWEGVDVLWEALKADAHVLEVKDKNIVLNGYSAVRRADLQAKNGVVHEISR
ncbi:hypothetical protein HDU93_005134 [Gonapodya sp. JEL0774]|nr:hypothetical protein HDU93_005134 [Gonapodya sp. JEL0774]